MQKPTRRSVCQERHEHREIREVGWKGSLCGTLWASVKTLGFPPGEKRLQVKRQWVFLQVKRHQVEKQGLNPFKQVHSCSYVETRLLGEGMGQSKEISWETIAMTRVKNWHLSGSSGHGWEVDRHWTKSRHDFQRDWIKIWKEKQKMTPVVLA